jgi:uncharacterized protein (TIGR02246 family)
MKTLIAGLVLLLMPMATRAQAPADEALVRQTVEAFYAAFNAHGFDHAADFTRDDWNHINPYGGRTRGRAAVLKELHEVHGSFLHGVSDNIEKLDVRLAGKDAAVATVTSRMSTFTSPDGVHHVNEEHIRTFVLTRRGTRWLIMQDQNTLVAPPPTP